MQLTTEITLDSPSNECKITLHKFFQFIILENLSDGRCKVIIYNAISYNSSEHSDSHRLIIKFVDEKGDSINDINFEDKINFYKNTEVLSQFWGKESRYESSILDAIQDFLPHDIQIEELHNELSKYNNNQSNAKDTTGVFCIKENKSEIKNILIKPQKASEENGKIILKQDSEKLSESLNKYISHGFWFKSSFEMDLNTGPNGFSYRSKIKTKNIKHISSPDFKTYIQTSKNYDIRSSQVSISNATEDFSGEIIKVFSQSKIKYFEEWSDLGIYNSSLFKVNHGTSGVKAIMTDGFNEIDVKSDMEDLELPRRREIHLLIFSIIFSLFTSFGFDRTRQIEDNGFSKIFPHWSYISLDAMWSIVCIGVLLTFFFIKSAHLNKAIKFFLTLPVSLWFIIYIVFYQSEAGQTLLTTNTDFLTTSFHALYYMNILVIAYMMTSITLIRQKRPKLVPSSKRPKSKMLKIFGV